MLPSDVETVASFAQRAKSWIQENLAPASHGSPTPSDDEHRHSEVAKARQLQRLIYDGGFAGIRYPVEYGGLGLSQDHQKVWRELTADRDIGCLMSLKVTHAIMGPTLLDFGTEEQKSRHIPAMLRGDELWVQFLSEPSAGSDLASLLTRAERSDDSYIINGSKIWSTGADVADYALCLARTNLDVGKHAGLSMLILPINSPGITLRPIQLATGRADFCEEFFDDVLVPRANLVGEENDGWAVVMRLFYHERNMVGGNSINDAEAPVVGESGASAEEELIPLARSVGKADDPHVRQLIGEAIALDRMSDYAIDRVNEAVRLEVLPASGASILKLMRTQSKYRIKEIALEIGGVDAVMKGADNPIGAHAHQWLVARIGTIAGGSSEMQRNAISERILGLPREAAADLNLTFREVLAQRNR